MTTAEREAGTLEDTYVAALQHELADVDADATRVGVVRRPTSWFHAAVDENVSALGPPTALLEETKQAEEDLKISGFCAEEAHNAAWDQTGFAEQYRKHLANDADARAALDRLAERLASGESLVLVCYENTDKKRCHRTILRDEIEGGL